ncbi:MAG: LysM domain-containing protein [Casimicrobiaceae bacterium]
MTAYRNKASKTGWAQGAVVATATLVAGLLAAGCATPPPPAPVIIAPPPPPAPVVIAEPPRPVAPVVPELTPAQAKSQSQRLAIETVDLLQNGDEAGARAKLEQAQQLDPSNDLARKLMDQVKADPQKELGSVSFRYTVQRDDSMSKLAAQYLGDRFRFYILARYNDIQNPSKLAAGQVIKIPGRAPAPGASNAATAPSTRTPAMAPTGTELPPSDEAAKLASVDSATPRNASAALMQQGQDLQKVGNLEGAYEAFRDAAQRDPGNRDAALQRDATRTALARRYERDATQAFQRQNLDEAITKWDRVLALEPSNQKAKLERERALDLRRRMSEKFGAAPPKAK